MFRYKIENDISISSTRKKISAKINVYIRIHLHIYKTLVISGLQHQFWGHDNIPLLETRLFRLKDFGIDRFYNILV